MDPVIAPHPPCDPQVRLTILVPTFTASLMKGLVNFGHGVFVGGAEVGLSVGLGVRVRVGVKVLVGVGVGGIWPCGRPDGSKLQFTNCPPELTQPVVDSPCSWTSSQEPSPFFANGRSTVPEVRVCRGGAYSRPGP